MCIGVVCATRHCVYVYLCMYVYPCEGVRGLRMLYIVFGIEDDESVREI